MMGQMAGSGRQQSGARERDPLERLLGLVEPPADSADGESTSLQVAGRRDDLPTWLVSEEWRLYARPSRELVTGGREMVRFELPDRTAVSASIDPARKAFFLPFSPAEAYSNYIAEQWTANSRRGLSPGLLNAFYRGKRFIPRKAQIQARLLRFYAYARLLARGENEAEFRWFWPERYKAAVILTHDVETGEGLRLAVELAELEEEYGFRSSFNLGAWYDADSGILRDLTQ